MYPKTFVEQIDGGEIRFRTYHHPSGAFHSDAGVFLGRANSVGQFRIEADRTYPTAELAEATIRQRALVGVGIIS